MDAWRGATLLAVHGGPGGAAAPGVRGRAAQGAAGEDAGRRGQARAGPRTGTQHTQHHQHNTTTISISILFYFFQRVLQCIASCVRVYVCASRPPLLSCHCAHCLLRLRTSASPYQSHHIASHSHHHSMSQTCSICNNRRRTLRRGPRDVRVKSSDGTTPPLLVPEPEPDDLTQLPEDDIAQSTEGHPEG